MAEQDLAGRTALVTGSTSGIGEATATQLARHGAHVIVVGRRQELGDGVVAAIRAAGGKADYVRAELSDAASARELAQRALEASGGQIDILINNAGTAEFGPAGVRVNAVSPGTTSTQNVVDVMGDGLDELGKQAPLGYVADADEIADAIVYLTTDKSSYITGTILNVDGGRTAI